MFSTTGLIVGSLIGAGASVGSAAIGANAAGKAAKQQAAAAEAARRYAEPYFGAARDVAAQQVQQAQAGFAPYQQAGTGGLSALTTLLGVQPGASPMPGAPASPHPATPLAEVGGLRRPSPAGTYTGQSAMVQLQAPNGQVKAVPVEQAEFYLARGARPVGRG